MKPFQFVPRELQHRLAMKRITQLTAATLIALGTLVHAANWTEGMKEGKPAFKSAGPLAFGPEGILFVADTKDAAVTAIATGDTTPAKETKALKIEAAPADGGLKVNTRYPKNNSGIMDWIAGTNVSLSVTYEVTVPRSMNLTLEDTNGAMDITDVHGAHHLETTNGHLELVRCGGSLDAETTNGAIRAELLEVTPGKNVRAETTNGRITLSVPRGLAARVDAGTTNGSITTDLPVTTTDTGHHSLRGTINGGGPELRLRTTNGSIEIKAAK